MSFYSLFSGVQETYIAVQSKNVRSLKILSSQKQNIQPGDGNGKDNYTTFCLIGIQRLKYDYHQRFPLAAVFVEDCRSIFAYQEVEFIFECQFGVVGWYWLKSLGYLQDRNRVLETDAGIMNARPLEQITLDLILGSWVQIPTNLISEVSCYVGAQCFPMFFLLKVLYGIHKRVDYVLRSFEVHSTRLVPMTVVVIDLCYIFFSEWRFNRLDCVVDLF